MQGFIFVVDNCPHMTTILNHKAQEISNFSEKELEILHMISFEYTIEEMMIESHLTKKEVQAIIQKLHHKTQTESYVGLIRVAYEQKIFILVES